MPSPEVTAIQDAYRDYIKGLFKTLIANLTDDHAADEDVAKFKAGVDGAKKALDLATSALAPAPPLKVATRRTKAARLVKRRPTKK